MRGGGGSEGGGSEGARARGRVGRREGGGGGEGGGGAERERERRERQRDWPAIIYVTTLPSAQKEERPKTCHSHHCSCDSFMSSQLSMSSMP